MEVVLLGTGSADGWPSPFCRCRSCRSAMASGEIRGQTAALVDDTVMLDCGPEAPRAALRCGRSLADVRYILFTHGHPDHVGPAVLLMRSWTERAQPLEVVGPPSALAQCRDWVGPQDPVQFTEVRAGVEVTLTAPHGDYRVRVLRADHDAHLGADAVLYDIYATAESGGRMMWATDTGPLPDDTENAIAGAGFDALFLEETFGTYTTHGTEHHDLPTFARTLAQLRRSGAVVDDTEVVAVHLSHYNPPGSELAQTLGQWGARPGRDGEVIRVGAGQPARRPTSERPVRTLVLGGARSGKSAYAESILAAESAVTYLATGGSPDNDAEWAQRVRLHRDRRPSSWSTIETTDVAAELRAADSPVLLDCLGTWLTARIDLHGGWDSAATDPVRADMDDLVAAWRDCAVPVVAVSNEVGSGVVPAFPAGRLFRDLLGALNTRVAAESDDVVLTVAGVPVPLRR